MSVEAVSYTHLDVYKRQAPEDVDKKISDVDAKAQALEYLKQAIGQDAVVNLSLIHI